jgi:histidinol-phosphate aminotransferase
VIRRLREYYRQFEELSPDEVSRGLRERRDAERASALAEVPPLDLSTPAWHEPPDPEAVNAATYALRRAVNTYPDDAPLREAIAARHGVTADQVAPGHGAGELLHSAFRAIGPGGEVAIAWPGWGPLPRLVHEAGGVPVPVPLTDAGAADPDALAAAVGSATTAVALCTPNDPTGAAVPAADVLRLAEQLADRVWLVIDAALADFERGQSPPAADPGAERNPPSPVPHKGSDPERRQTPYGQGGSGPLTRDPPTRRGGSDPLMARARVLVVRSFSKAHAMAGFRAGYALADDAELIDRLSPAGGVSAPAQAAMLWAVRDGDLLVARRRAAAARERERLAAALSGSPFSFPAGHGHLVWLRSTAHDGATIARGLAARRIYVTPGTAWGDDLHVRVALRDGAATDRLSAALREL